MTPRAQKKKLVTLWKSDPGQAVELLAGLAQAELWEAVLKEALKRVPERVIQRPLVSTAPAMHSFRLAERAPPELALGQQIRALAERAQVTVNGRRGQGVDLSVLKGLPRVGGVGLRVFGIAAGVSGWEHLVALRPRRLSLHTVLLPDWALLNDCAELEELDLERVKVQQEGPLTLQAPLVRLRIEQVGLSRVQLESPVLERLEINCRGLEALQLGPSPRLETVRIQRAEQLTSLSGLAPALAAGAPLRSLVVHPQSLIRSLEPLAQAGALEELELGPSAVGDLSPLQGAPRLRRLSLGGSQVETVEPLADAPALELLDLRGCARLSAVDALVGAPALRIVALSGTAVQPDAAPAALRDRVSWAEHPAWAWWGG